LAQPHDSVRSDDHGDNPSDLVLVTEVNHA
jgi:hypothetical protein